MEQDDNLNKLEENSDSVSNLTENKELDDEIIPSSQQTVSEKRRSEDSSPLQDNDIEINRSDISDSVLVLDTQPDDRDFLENSQSESSSISVVPETQLPTVSQPVTAPQAIQIQSVVSIV